MRNKIITGIVVLLFVSTNYSKSQFINSLVESLKQYNTYKPLERTFFQTDKSIYEPGETIWLKGYVYSSFPGDSIISKDLFIEVIDVFGNKLTDIRYPLNKTTFTGSIDIPEKTENGKYMLIAYTGWMKNLDPVNAYAKDIFITQSPNSPGDLNINFDKSSYPPSNKVTAKVKITGIDASEANKIKLDYTVNCMSETILQDNEKFGPDGLASITFSLPETIKEGIYVLNLSAKGHNVSVNKAIRIPVAPKKINVEFFPENDHLVAGILNNIAFKITDSYGLPVQIEGNLLDDKGNLITGIKSDKNGLGQFDLMPEKGKSYSVRISSPAGFNSSYSLPEVKESGYVLRYNGISDHALNFILTASGNSHETTTYWVAQKNQNIYWGANIKMSKTKQVRIPLRNFPSGIIQLAVFDEKENLIAESFVYARPEKSTLISVETEKQTYKPFEKITLKIKKPILYPERFPVTLSVSVVNTAALVPYPENLILESNRPVAYIENLFFTHQIPEEELNLYIRTSKPTGIDWKMLKQEKNTKIQAPLAYSGITGKVTDKEGIPVKNAEVSAHDDMLPTIYKSTSDTNGNFSLNLGKNIVDLNYFNIEASGENGKKSFQALENQDFSKKLDNMYITTEKDWSQKKIMDIITYTHPEYLYTDKYQIIQNSEPIRQKEDDRLKINYASYTNILDILKYIKPFQIINNQIVFPGAGGINSFFNQTGALIVIDGRQSGTDIGVLNMIPTPDIENIRISTDVTEIHKYTGMNSQGVIEITTKRGKFNSDSDNGDEYTSKYNRTFNAIDLSESKSLKKTNLLTTLFWEPFIKLNNNGEGEITFYNLNTKGTYECIIQEFDQTGNPSDADYKYKVE